MLPPWLAEEFFSLCRTIAPRTLTLVHNLEGHLYGSTATKVILGVKKSQISHQPGFLSPLKSQNLYLFVIVSSSQVFHLISWYIPSLSLGNMLCGDEAAVWEQNKTRERVADKRFMKYFGSLIKGPKTLTTCKMSDSKSPSGCTEHSWFIKP